MADLLLLKRLREATSCGIADCNKALDECDNNFDRAVDWLRVKSLSSAVKKSGKITSEGLIGIKVSLNKAVIIEVNSQTDFVSRSLKFQYLVQNVLESAIGVNCDLKKLKSLHCHNSNLSVEDELKNNIGILGENINIRRIEHLEINQGLIAGYIHNAIADNMGRIGVLVALCSSGDKSKLKELGDQIAMHIAAARPDFISIDSVNPSSLSREIEVLKEQVKNSNKPSDIIEKMIQGRIKKYYEEVVLLEQAFVMNDKIKIKDLVFNFSKEIGANIEIKDFKLFILGDGIEKKSNNFASEVAEILA